MKCKNCCFRASDTLLGDCICELRTSNPANWRSMFPEDSECKYPTERRAALIAQLDTADREALELGCRVQALEMANGSIPKICGYWQPCVPGINQSMRGGYTPLEALRNQLAQANAEIERMRPVVDRALEWDQDIRQLTDEQWEQITSGCCIPGDNDCPKNGYCEDCWKKWYERTKEANHDRAAKRLDT
jgi:hypothetical protein